MNIRFGVGTFLVALVGGGIGLFLILPLGLIVSEFVIFPLALAIAALLAALSTSCAGTLLATDQTRTRILPVVRETEGAALGIALVFLICAALGVAPLGPWLLIGGLCIVILALIASMATGRFREPKQGAPGTARLTLSLLLLAVLIVPLVVWIASLLGLAGA
jgi:hypothetical protein